MSNPSSSSPLRDEPTPFKVVYPTSSPPDSNFHNPFVIVEYIPSPSLKNIDLLTSQKDNDASALSPHPKKD